MSENKALAHYTEAMREQIRAAFELRYAREWDKQRRGVEATIEELAAEVKSWRDGDTYPDDLPRLRIGWECYQWAIAAEDQARAFATIRPLLEEVRDALATCDAAHITDGGRQWFDGFKVDAAHAKVEAFLLAMEPAA